MMPIELNAFLKEAESSRVVPVLRKIFFSGETPLSIFEKLGSLRDDSFLLESADQGVWSRYSFIGAVSRGRLFQEMNGALTWVSPDGSALLPKDSDEVLPSSPLEAIELVQRLWSTDFNELGLPLTSGLVGMIGWDLVRDLETLPAPKKQVLETPRISFTMIRDLVVVDHQTSELTFISNVYIEGQSESELIHAFSRANENIDAMVNQLKNPRPSYFGIVNFEAEITPEANFVPEQFLSVVDSAKDFVRIGDVFQVVLSQAFSGETEASPLEIYRVLRALNPSPYMYLINGADSLGKFSIVGSSPEALVTVNSGHVVTHPIAGSRPRGATTEIDQDLESALLKDNKERAEHLMLVDLARNDLLRVCEPSSVAVTEFMAVHKYSHIMHLVSTVEGELSPGCSPIQVFKATFPAGTLSGAPKPRALEIIEDLEPTHRGLYGGVCGYFDFAGNSDLAIAIRTAFVRDGKFVVQAGAGLVLDSDPESEYQETRSKARAVLRAIAAANYAKEI
jgi:anthranilate synthase component 1